MVWHLDPGLSVLAKKNQIKLFQVREGRRALPILIKTEKTSIREKMYGKSLPPNQMARSPLTCHARRKGLSSNLTSDSGT